MVNTDYSDDTLDVVYQYDNFGRFKQVDQGDVNRHVYAYNPTNLLLDTETITYGLNNSSPFVRVMDHSDRDTLLREKTCVLRNGTDAEHTVGKTYDTAGRVETITHGGDQVHTYNYVTNTYTLPAGITSPAHSVINTYEPTRNVLSAKSNQVASNEVSRYDYTVNDLGQRISIGRSGTAFATAATETAGYNARGEVVQTTIPGQIDRNQSYNFDGIGNRTSATEGTVETSYAPNAVNEYVTVAGSSQTHDDDGNLIDNGTFTFNWDAENRLLSVTDKVSNNVVIDYKYDYQSRRIECNNSEGKTTWIYHGWNPCGQYLDGILDRTYTWGTDLSGSEQGAGGVGGLLSVTDVSSAGHYFPTFDGNGNISEYVNSQGETVAHYEYDAFGNTVVEGGIISNFFEHRFSTKPTSKETGFYYYGYRYYDPVTGRWASRDPIAEQGGLNLYGFVKGRPFGFIDYLGLDPVDFYNMTQSIVNPSNGVGFDGGNQQSSDLPMPSRGPGSIACAGCHGTIDGEYSNIAAGEEPANHLQGIMPPASDPSLYAGFEFGVAGGGYTRVSCCDENRCRRKMNFVKICFGMMSGISASGGHVSQFEGTECKAENYKGVFLELGFIHLGVGAGLDLGFDQEAGIWTGVNEGGIAIGTPGVQIAKCYYIQIGDTEIVSGNNGCN